MQISRFQVSVRWMMVSVAVLAIGLSFVFGGIERRTVLTEYQRESSRFSRLLVSLLGRAPRGVDQGAWDDALQLIYELSYNSGLSKSRRRVHEFERLCDEFERKLKGNVEPEMIPWLWERFARSSETGRSYAESESQSFKKVLDRLKRSTPCL